MSKDLTEYKKAWYEKNKTRLLEKAKQYRNKNKDRILEYARNIPIAKKRAYREKHKENHRAATKKWKQENKQHLKNYSRAYASHKIATDLQFKLSACLRKRIIRAIRSDQKAGSAVRDLGCTIKEFKAYLETKFQPGMSWENWSIKGWHIDHIKPLSSFDLSNREEFLRACHYTNMQPLWAIDNLKKSDIICYSEVANDEETIAA